MNLEVTELKNFHNLLTGLAGDGLAVRVKTAGLSMYPRIAGGDCIHILPVLPGRIRRGDIVVFKQSDQFICHRVKTVFARQEITWFATQGDSSIYADSPISGDAVVGIVSKIQRSHCSSKRKMALQLSSLLKFSMPLHRVVFSLLLKHRRELKK